MTSSRTGVRIPQGKRCPECDRPIVRQHDRVGGIVAQFERSGKVGRPAKRLYHADCWRAVCHRIAKAQRLTDEKVLQVKQADEIRRVVTRMPTILPELNEPRALPSNLVQELLLTSKRRESSFRDLVNFVMELASQIEAQIQDETTIQGVLKHYAGKAMGALEDKVSEESEANHMPLKAWAIHSSYIAAHSGD